MALYSLSKDSIESASECRHFCRHCGDSYIEYSQVSESTLDSKSRGFCCMACEKLFAFSHENNFLDLTNQKISKIQNRFTHYDDPKISMDFEKKSENQRSFFFYIEGLQCSSCVHLIEKLPEFNPHIKSSTLNFANATLQLELDAIGKLSTVLSLIEELGYHAYPLREGENVEARHQLENRSALIRLGVAGACMGNIMLFVIPIYSGLTGTMATVFSWISFFLFLPILGYSAVPFYKSAWNSLKYRTLSIDLPITIALWAGFLVSTYNLIQGRFETYFDSTAGFMFLILGSRFLLKRLQNEYLTQPTLSEFLKDSSVEKFENNQWVRTHIEQLKINDRIRVEQDKVIPADGQLLSESAYIDLSLLNGEALPQLNHHGMRVFAGTKNCGEEIEIKIEKLGHETQIGSLLRLLTENSFKKTPFASLTDRLSQGLILVVFSIAVVFFLIYSQISPNEALNRALALIVLACPCALAFGTPLAQGLAMKKAKKLGIIVKSPVLFEKILKIENLFFDKTGTLTDGSLNLIQMFPPNPNDSLKSIILGLESQSQHPIAQCLRRTWDNTPPARISQKREIPSVGVEGMLEDHFYEIKSSSSLEDRGLLQVEILRDHQKIGYLYFSDRLRAESPKVVKTLQRRFKSMLILSGDKGPAVKEVALQCGILPDLAIPSLKAETKAHIISNYKNTLMIGDGANDALALQKADVGIAVRGSVELSLAHSDVYFTKGGLQPLVELLKLSEQAQRTIQTNISISLIYNFIGGTLALMGFVSPWLAAVLMPLSTALLIASTVWGLR